MARTRFTIDIDTSSIEAAVSEIRDLYGNGAGIPERLKAQLYRIAAGQVDKARMVRLEGLKPLPGSEIEALLRRLRIVRGAEQ